MYPCPKCGKNCEWQNDAFVCDDCEILFFSIECKQRFANYVNRTFSRIDNVIQDLEKGNRFLYKLEMEHLNSKEKMPAERKCIYDAFSRNHSLRIDIQASKEADDVSYPNASTLLHKLYEFECSTKEIEQIAKAIAQEFKA